MDSRLPKALPRLLSVLLLLSPLPALAVDPSLYPYKGESALAPEMAVKTLNEGMYIGIAAGYESYRIHPNIHATLNGDTVSANPVLNANGFVGGLFGGYGHYFNNLFYLGAEALVNNTGAGSTSTFLDQAQNASFTTQFSVKTSFGFSVNPGIKINPSTLFYLKGGLAWVDIQNQENMNFGGSFNSVTTKNWTRGTLVGLGLESALYKALSVRAEFNHFDYNTSSYSAIGTNYTPRDNQFMLGLIYHIV